MASNVVSDNFETGTGGVPQLGGADRQTQWCKAWVNFNGTGTVAIRDSYNVSSITDRGTGKYTLNFTNAMANINYSLSGMCFLTSDGTYAHQPQIGYREPTAPLTTTTAKFNICFTQSVSYLDTEYITLQVFGD